MDKVVVVGHRLFEQFQYAQFRFAQCLIMQLRKSRKAFSFEQFRFAQLRPMSILENNYCVNFALYNFIWINLLKPINTSTRML